MMFHGSNASLVQVSAPTGHPPAAPGAVLVIWAPSPTVDLDSWIAAKVRTSPRNYDAAR
jgi:hypothetical protein